MAQTASMLRIIGVSALVDEVALRCGVVIGLGCLCCMAQHADGVTLEHTVAECSVSSPGIPPLLSCTPGLVCCCLMLGAACVLAGVHGRAAEDGADAHGYSSFPSANASTSATVPVFVEATCTVTVLPAGAQMMIGADAKLADCAPFTDVASPEPTRVSTPR